MAIIGYDKTTVTILQTRLNDVKRNKLSYVNKRLVKIFLSMCLCYVIVTIMHVLVNYAAQKKMNKNNYAVSGILNIHK